MCKLNESREDQLRKAVRILQIKTGSDFYEKEETKKDIRQLMDLIEIGENSCRNQHRLMLKSCDFNLPKTSDIRKRAVDEYTAFVQNRIPLDYELEGKTLEQLKEIQSKANDQIQAEFSYRRKVWKLEDELREIIIASMNLPSV